MDKNCLRASAFLKRASESSDSRQKLLCLYDGFVCLYGPMDACRKAAGASGLDISLLERAIDSCMDEGDGPSTDPVERVEISEDMVGRLFKALTSLTGSI